MVIPEPIARAAQDGRVTAVAAWLNEGGVNDRDELDDTLLILCAATPDTLTASHTDLVRLLIDRGADLNSLTSLRHDGTPAQGIPALHYACDRTEDVSADMVSLLLNGKANVHCRVRDAPPRGCHVPRSYSTRHETVGLSEPNVLGRTFSNHTAHNNHVTARGSLVGRRLRRRYGRDDTWEIRGREA